MTASFWQDELDDWRESFGCLSPLVCRRYVKAVIGELDAARKENARWRSRIVELERSLALDSTNSSKPPTSDGPGKKGKRTESERARTGRPRGGQPGRKGVSMDELPSPSVTPRWRSRR